MKYDPISNILTVVTDFFSLFLIRLKYIIKFSLKRINYKNQKKFSEIF